MRWLLTIISLFALAISVSVPAWAFNETHLKKLKALHACKGCDLSGANLFRAKLTKTDLSAANHDGDSDSTASIAGQIYGDWHGDDVLPDAWIEKLDIKEVMDRLLVEFATQHSASIY